MTNKISLYHGSNSNIFLSMQSVGPRLLSKNMVRKLGGLCLTGEFLHNRKYEGDIICFKEGLVPGLKYYTENRFDPEWIKKIIAPKRPGYCPEEPEQLKFLEETLRVYESLPEHYKEMVLKSFPVIFGFNVPSLQAFGEFYKTYESPLEHQFLHEITLSPFLDEIHVPKKAPNLDKLLEMSGINLKSVTLKMLK